MGDLRFHDRLGIAVAVLAFVCAGTARAENGALGGIIDEAKIGIEAHDITFGGRHKENGADINEEILFVSPGFLSVIGAPRPHLGGQINTAGNTDQAYAGLTWGAALFDRILGQSDALSIYGSLGGAYQDGYQNEPQVPGRKDLGAAILFRESAELGYQICPVASISMVVDHISNANLAPHNAGITNAGARIGFKF